MERTIDLSAIRDDFEARGLSIIRTDWKCFSITEDVSPEDAFKFRCAIRHKITGLAAGMYLVLDKSEVRAVKSRLYQINDNYYAEAARRYLEVVAHWVDEVDAIYSNETSEEDE